MVNIEKRALGNTDIEVSIISLGTVKFGRNQQVKYKEQEFELPEDSTLNEIIDICLEHGVNLLDTAPAYGITEERLGQILGEKRKSFVISTKVGEEFDGKQSSYDFSKQTIRASVERSFKRIRTDYLDSVLLHCNREDLDLLQNSDALETLSELKEQGLIRAFGASTHTLEGSIYAIQNSDLAMLPFNPDYQEHLPAIKLAEDLHKGVLIKKGLFAGHIDEINPEETLKKCFMEVFQHKGVSSFVMGTINPKHLMQNIKVTASIQ